MSDTKPSLENLLLLPFVAKFQEIYKDDPEMLSSFQDLTVNDIEVTDIVIREDGTNVGTIRSATRHFEAPGQQWVPANLHSEHVFELTNEELYATKEEALNQTVAGVYAYLGAEGETLYVLVVSSEEALKNDLQAALGYKVLLSNIQDSTVEGSDQPKVKLETPYLTGEISYGLVKSGMRMLPEGSIMQLGAK